MTDELTNRQRFILIGLIEEYVRTAEPQSSASLQRVLKLDVSTATIRNILKELETMGLVMQLHTSAGRIPTDYGYRYYVDHIRQERLNQKQLATLTHNYEELLAKHEHLARATAKLLSALTGSVAVSGLNSEQREQVIAGLSELFKYPEGNSLETVKQVSDMIDSAEEQMAEFPAGSEPTVMIGEEIDFADAPEVGLVAKRFVTSDGRELTVMIMGPKRMAYGRNIALLEALNDLL